MCHEGNPHGTHRAAGYDDAGWCKDRKGREVDYLPPLLLLPRLLPLEPPFMPPLRVILLDWEPLPTWVLRELLPLKLFLVCLFSIFREVLVPSYLRVVALPRS